jgi:hypothetical protein
MVVLAGVHAAGRVTSVLLRLKSSRVRLKLTPPPEGVEVKLSSRGARLSTTPRQVTTL